MAFLQAFMDGLQEVQAYLKTGETPPGFLVMPISPEQAPDAAAAKMGKRPGSSKARDDLSGGPGISKDAGRFLTIFLQPLHWSSWMTLTGNAEKVPSECTVCSLCTALAAKF